MKVEAILKLGLVVNLHTENNEKFTDIRSYENAVRDFKKWPQIMRDFDKTLGKSSFLFDIEACKILKKEE